MKKIFSILLVSIALISCEENVDFSVPCDEGVEATLRDLTGLDGCGFVFVLDDGTKLEPYRLAYCGTPPLPKEVTEDPLYQFEWIDGRRVKIGYEQADFYESACITGIRAKITCIEKLDTAPATED